MAAATSAFALCATVAVLITMAQVGSAAGGGGGGSGPAVDPSELTFPQLRDKYNTTRQWRLAMASSRDGAPFVPVNCTNPNVGACTDRYVPLEQGTNDRLLVNWTMFQLRQENGTRLSTYLGMMPTKVQIRACYSVNSSVNRAWRTKNKPYPRLSQNCPRTIVTYPFNGTSLDNPDFAANSGSYIWELNKEDGVPIATWFLMMWVYCGDAQVCAFESTEGRTDVTPTVDGNFVETNVEMGITPAMKASAITLSIFSGLFFFVFLAADHYYYKKTGKPIVIC